uniref:TOG domain-containing protein n=1 Tax=Ditylenchus dipsaci TaxID=166011 RepID=A0A915D2E4_9BILA
MQVATTEQQFEQLVAGMLSAENETRSAAEKNYEQIQLGAKGTLLFNLYINGAANVESRSLALVLLRRIFSSSYEEFWTEVGADSKEQFHSQVLKCMGTETEPILKKRLTDVLAEMARNTINDDSGKQEWTGVLQFLEVCATSAEAGSREISMSLIESVPNIFGSDQQRYMQGIKQMFQSSLLYGTDSSVRTAAVRAYVAFVCDNEENDGVVRSLSDLVPAVIQVCQHVVATEDDDDVPLQCLSDLATSVPKTLTPHLNEIFTLCVSTVSNRDKDDSYRHSGLEVMVSLCESAPNVIRKRGAEYLTTLIQQCLQLMTELDDDVTEWSAMDDADDEMEEENAGIGETSLDRISCALGGKSVLTHTLRFVQELLNNEDWKCRHAAIMALSTIGEGCKRQMESLISEVVSDLVMPSIVDPHPRVRYAGCNALGQMCTDFAPTVQKKCHEKIVPALLTTLVNLSTPRVAAHAGAAIVNFCEECPKSIIAIYLPSIMEKMETVLDQTFRHLLENGKKIVLEQVITSIASVADAAQDHFIQFYSRLMPPLKYILENSNVDNLKLLRGKTIECISLIGLAVGKETFQADANEIMKILLTAGISFENSDDPQISYMISAWARICKILGEEFAQYLDAVMPAVLQTADFKPDVTVVDEDDANGEDEDWNFISLGDQRSLGIKTAGLEDKVTACEMLVCYARELKGSFAPYVEKVMNLMLPLLKFIFHDGVRSAAAECLPCLLVCAKGRGVEYLRQMWGVILPAYKEAIAKESDLDVLCELMNGVGQCIEDLGADVVTAADMECIFEIIHEQLNHFDKRRAEREKNNKDEEVDEEDQEHMNEILELETSVLARVSDLVHYSFVTFKENLIPLSSVGICIFDDVIEFGGEASLHYQNIFFGPIIKALGDSFPEVRQAAAYGCGIMALKGGPSYAQHCAQALQPLAAAINRTDSRATEEDTAATENAISAVAKILKHNSSAIDPNAVIPVFLNWLPVWNDTDEVPYVYDYFCDLVEANHPAVLGDNNSNLPKIFEIILYTFSHGVFEENSDELKPVKDRLTNIMKMLKANDQIILANMELVHSKRIGPRTAPKIYTEDRSGCYIWTKTCRTVNKDEIDGYFRCSGCKGVKDQNPLRAMIVSSIKFNLSTSQWVDAEAAAEYQHVCLPKNNNEGLFSMVASMQDQQPGSDGAVLKQDTKHNGNTTTTTTNNNIPCVTVSKDKDIQQPVDLQKKEEETEQLSKPVIRLRNKGSKDMQLREDPPLPESNGGVQEAPANGLLPGQGNSTTSAAALLHRTMEALYEASPDMEDNTEEIRRLDSQLDHLNEYMDKVEERLKIHNEKLMETLKQQKEDREKRRRSFHERLEASRQEDDDFQRQLNQMLNKVDLSRQPRNRHSMSEIPVAGEAGLDTSEQSGQSANDQ